MWMVMCGVSERRLGSDGRRLLGVGTAEPVPHWMVSSTVDCDGAKQGKREICSGEKEDTRPYLDRSRCFLWGAKTCTEGL